MSASLVGSEMCIRDSSAPSCTRRARYSLARASAPATLASPEALKRAPKPVSYTHLTLPTICSV
eukprot:10868959-Alexandrium_andersonii.AAC.1